MEVQRETGRWAFVDMFTRFSPSNRHLREAVADQRYGQLRVLEIEARTVVLLGYPQAVARLTSSSLMPQPYEIRGGYRATFTDAVLEYEMRAGNTGQGPSTLTETSADGEHPSTCPAPGPPRR